jgi:hypothetical protein
MTYLLGMLARKERQNWFLGSFSEAGMDALLALNKKQERRLLR